MHQFWGNVQDAAVALGHIYRDEWRNFKMHFANPAIPIEGFISYAQYRKSRCSVCSNPRIDIDGDSRYCSIECAAHDAEMQAIA